MFRLVPILMPLAAAQVRSGLRSARRKAVFIGLASVFGLVAVVFALVLITVLIAGEIGAPWALAVMAAAAAVAGAVCLLVLRRIEAEAAKRRSFLRDVPTSVYVSSLGRVISATRRPRSGRAIGFGLLALGAVFMLLRGGGDEADD